MRIWMESRNHNSKLKQVEGNKNELEFILFVYRLFGSDLVE